MYSRIAWLIGKLVIGGIVCWGVGTAALTLIKMSSHKVLPVGLWDDNGNLMIVNYCSNLPINSINLVQDEVVAMLAKINEGD